MHCKLFHFVLSELFLGNVAVLAIPLTLIARFLTPPPLPSDTGTATHWPEYLLYNLETEEEERMQEVKNAAVPYNNVGLLEVRWTPLAGECLVFFEGQTARFCLLPAGSRALELSICKGLTDNSARSALQQLGVCVHWCIVLRVVDAFLSH